MKSTAPKFINQNQKKKSWKRNESLIALKRAKVKKNYIPKKASVPVKKSFTR